MDYNHRNRCFRKVHLRKLSYDELNNLYDEMDEWADRVDFWVGSSRKEETNYVDKYLSEILEEIGNRK